MSDRGVEQIIERAKEKLTSAKTEWEHRVTELRMIRLIALEQLLFEYTAAELRKLAPAFNTALADLRSTVTREACVTGKFYFLKLSLTNKASVLFSLEAKFFEHFFSCVFGEKLSTSTLCQSCESDHSQSHQVDSKLC